MNVAIICAAGSGRRLGKKMPKALVLVAGVPMFIYSLRTMAASAAINGILLVVPRGYQDEFEQSINKYISTGGRKKIIGTVFGGAERQDSIKHGLDHLVSIGISDDSPVIVHNAANIFLSSVEILRILKVIKKGNGSAVALPSTDTLRELDSKMRPVRQLSREVVWRMQTPQGASLGDLTKAYQAALRSGHYGTDDVELLCRIKHRITIVRGNALNFKITYPEDLLIAEAIIKCGKK